MDNKDFFDGMFDFNGDGKTDLMEEGLAYQMMDDFDNQFRENSTSSSSSSSGSTIIVIIGTILVFLALGSIITACDNNSRNSTGRYSYSHSYKSYSGSPTKSNSSAYSYQSKTTSSAVQPATKKSTYKSYSSKSKSPRIMLTLMISITTIMTISTIMRMRRIIITSIIKYKDNIVISACDISPQEL